MKKINYEQPKLIILSNTGFAVNGAPGAPTSDCADGSGATGGNPGSKHGCHTGYNATQTCWTGSVGNID